MTAALAVSLSARTGNLTAQAVEEMRIRAEELLAPADPFRAACLTFATMYEVHVRDAAALRAMGEALAAALDKAARAAAPAPPPDPTRWPDPVGADRRDIHG
ncbi:MAG TPA: hypothetical protein PKD10_05295 [Paracoccaceae bacterium]|nr:hypothetical protein [Paracoccaceae bacterium]HMO70108.1 hypothetical protein [Paracoccaceae bacterium]